jgi:hypothetical protein
VCIDDWGLSILCKRVRFDCPDLEAVKTLEDYDQWQDSFTTDRNVTEIQSQPFSRYFVEKLNQFVFRLTTANSLFVLYRAITIFFGSAYVITRGSWTEKLHTCQLSKFRWVILLLILWYVGEYLVLLFSTNEFSLYLSSVYKNPCILDNDYLTLLYGVVRSTCDKMVSLENRWNIAHENYDYHFSIDQSYVNLGSEQIYYQHIDEWNHPWNGTCDEQKLLPIAYRTTIANNPNVQEWIRRIGGISMLFLQTVLALLLVNIFQYIYPLSANAGKIILPTDREKVDTELLVKIRRYVKISALPGIVFYTCILILICIVNVI